MTTIRYKNSDGQFDIDAWSDQVRQTDVGDAEQYYRTQTTEVIKLSVKKPKYKANTARDIWYRTLQFYEGKILSQWLAAVEAVPPTLPSAGKSKGKADHPTGWLKFFARNGYIDGDFGRVQPMTVINADQSGTSKEHKPADGPPIIDCDKETNPAGGRTEYQQGSPRWWYQTVRGYGRQLRATGLAGAGRVRRRIDDGNLPARLKQGLANYKRQLADTAGDIIQSVNEIIAARTAKDNESLAYKRISIVASSFNGRLVEPLLDACLEALKQQGLKDDRLKIIRVPGAFEIPGTVRHVIRRTKSHAIITLGVVVKGQTRHFEYICSQCSRGLMQLSIDHRLPIIFGVLTVDDQQQALERVKRKGAEAASAAVDMIRVFAEK